MSFIQIPVQLSPNTALGVDALVNVTTGVRNVALGKSALKFNTTGNYNTAIGESTLVGLGAASSYNTAVGFNAGFEITTGQKNVILGSYTGNQGGLDIRTLSNYVVLSDGDGNPRLYIDNTGLVTAPGGFAGAGGTITLNNKTAAYTVVAGDLGKIINCTANTFTVSLTAAATLGSGFACFVWNTGTGTITVDPNGAETIDGVATIVLYPGEGMQIVCNGTNWETSSKKTMRQYSENTFPGGSRPSASTFSALALGEGAGAAGTYSYAIGFGSFAATTNANALGVVCYANKGNTTAIGNNAYANNFGKIAFAEGQFSNLGDSQRGLHPSLRAQTAGAAATDLTTDGAAAGANNQINIASSTAYAFTGTVVARQQAAGGTASAAWSVSGLIRREAGAATTTLVASTVTVISNVPAWTLALSADTVNGALKVTGTGAAATNIRWVATIDTSEVTYA